MREFLPHDRVDLAGRYAGQEGREIGWVRHHADDALGLVNFAQAIAPAKEAVGYAYVELTSPRELAGQMRCGADDNCTVWLNGEKVFGREQWLNGSRFDRFVAPVTLRRGPNHLLVKICQGPQHKDPQVPNNWSLQLRLCDEEGKGLPLQNALTNAPEAQEIMRSSLAIVRFADVRRTARGGYRLECFGGKPGGPDRKLAGLAGTGPKRNHERSWRPVDLGGRCRRAVEGAASRRGDFESDRVGRVGCMHQLRRRAAARLARCLSRSSFGPPPLAHSLVGHRADFVSRNEEQHGQSIADHRWQARLLLFW